MKSETQLLSASASTSGNAKSALAKLRRKLSPRRSDINDHKHIDRSSSSSSSSSTIIINSNNRTELQRIFNYFDENGDGKITAQELQNCVRTLGGELSTVDAEAAVMSSDMDGDGMLGMEDFERLMEGSSTSEEEKKEELKQAFGMYESEPGSGFISPSSLKRMLGRLGNFSSLDDCKAMIRTFDLNGDGLLSFNEFAVMMR